MVANAAPMQRRMPPPYGIHSAGSGGRARNLSGSKRRASGKTVSSACRPAFVDALQHHRQHVVASVEFGVGERRVDQPVDGRIVFPPIAVEPPPWTPPAPIPLEHRN